MKDIRVDSHVVDDGTKSGGLGMGYQATNGNLHHRFNFTLGNRVSRFNWFNTYKVNDNLTLATASQG